jgi:hemolysin D
MAIRLGWSQPATAVERSLEGQPLSIMEFESPSAAVIAEPIPLASRSAIWWISAMLFLLLMVAAFVPQDIVVTASGKVVATSDTVVIQPLDQSIIKSINVRVGQLVRKGQLLTTLDPTLTGADLDAYRKAVAETTPAVARLTAEKQHKIYTPTDPNDLNQELQQKLFEQRRAERIATDANYNQQIASLEAQISGNLEQAEYYRQRLGLNTDIETLREKEEQLQVGSKLNSLEAADTRVSMEASMQQAIASAQSEKAQLLATQAMMQSDDATFDAATMQTLSDTTATLDTAVQNLQKAGLHSGLVEMRAPSDAVVLQVEKLSVGSVIQPGEQYIQLSPLDKPLAVEAYISGSDIGWVHPGDYVQIKFDTFMYQEYGDARGHVVSVTVDSFMAPQAGTANVPIYVSTGASDPSQTQLQSTTMSPIVNVFYVSQIVIDRMNLKHVPKDFRLLPGMPLAADIRVGWRTYLDYIFARVAPVFNEAMREP